MLQLSLEQISIVVQSDGNNPRLLNHDFLERNSIVPSGWSVANVIITPPLAIVDYANGIRVQSEEAKLLFTCFKPAQFPWTSDLPRLATTFLDVLPHVNYRAVGLNYVVIADEPKGPAAEKQLIYRLLLPGRWQGFRHGLTGANIQLEYKSKLPHILLKFGAREDLQTKELIGYVFHANFHHDFAPERSAERRQFIEQLQDRYAELTELIQLLPLDSEWKLLPQ